MTRPLLPAGPPWPILFALLLLVCMALAACAPHAAPPVYALPLPPVAEEPAAPSLVAAPDDVASAVGLLRGDVAPGDGL